MSDLQDATFVFPSLDSAIQSNARDSQLGFGLLTFAQPLQRKLIERSLPREWKITKTNGRKIYVNQKDDLAMFFASPNTISVGNEKGIRWFFENRRNLTDTGIRLVTKLNRKGQVTFGVNGEAIPTEIMHALQPEFNPFTNVKSAAGGIDFTDGIAVNASVKFASPSDAATASHFVQAQLHIAQGMLKHFESEALAKVDAGTPDLFSALEPISALASSRFAQKVLGSLELNQTSDQLDANVAVTGFSGQMVLMTCLTAIQAVGSVPEAEFQRLADDLKEPTANSKFEDITDQLKQPSAKGQFNDIADQLKARGE